MKRHHYRIYAINLPRDLPERIAAIHAAAILRTGNSNEPVQGMTNKKSSKAHGRPKAF
jgi:hypothetical protein